MVTTFRPGKGDAVSTRKLSQSKEDRQKHLKEFRDNKNHQQKLKEERFAKIAEKRKQQPSSSKGKGIDVRVGGDN